MCAGENAGEPLKIERLAGLLPHVVHHLGV